MGAKAHCWTAAFLEEHGRGRQSQGVFASGRVEHDCFGTSRLTSDGKAHCTKLIGHVLLAKVVQCRSLHVGFGEDRPQLINWPVLCVQTKTSACEADELARERLVEGAELI